MAVEESISATKLARSISDVLNRIYYRGERFLVQRGGKTVAALGPPASGPIPLSEVLAGLEGLEPPDNGFADDLEAIQAGQSDAEVPPWPS
jgi:hypothetical protein